MVKKTIRFFICFVFFITANGISQNKSNKKERSGEFYFSWGYNKEWYTNTDLHINQPSEGNNYKMKAIQGHDHPGWDEGLFSKALTIPQYNYRIGYIFNKEKGWGIEINFDHTKYIVKNNQNVRVVGTYKGETVDQEMLFTNTSNDLSGNSSFWYLNNGANFLLFNVVKRSNLFQSTNENIKLDFLTKLGIGPVIPHVENKLFDQPRNNPHFQIGGWNVGAEGAFRSTFFKYVYLEYAIKMDYARYSGLKIYNGTARQAFGTFEEILNLGVTFPIGKVVKNN